MDEGPSAVEADRPTYMDIRDDRVYTYFNLSPYSSYHRHYEKTFRVKLSASYAGKFYHPAVSVESMYNKNFSASKAGLWVEVVKND